MERLQARCKKLILDLDKADSHAAEEMRLKDEAEERVRVLRRQLGTFDEPGSAILEAIQQGRDAREEELLEEMV